MNDVDEDRIEDRVTIGPGLLPELLTPMPQVEYDARRALDARDEDWRQAWARACEDMRRVRR